MRFKQIGGKADAVTVTVKSAESSSIPQGSPLILAMNGTDDGLAVVLPSTAGDAQTNALFYGIAPVAIAPAALTDVIAFGYVPYAKLLVATRGASTDDWSSSASLDSWGILVVDTINDALSLQAASQDLGDFMPFVVLAQSVASVASSGSATSDTRTAITSGKKVFVRLL